MFNFKKKPMFVCIGTELHEADKLAPWIGTCLQNTLQDDYNVFGTLGDNIYRPNAKERVETIKSIVTPKEQIIAVDIGFNLGNNAIFIKKGGIRPAGFLGSDIPEIGDVSIIINCAVGSIEDFFENKFSKEQNRILKNRANIALKFCHQFVDYYEQYRNY